MMSEGRSYFSVLNKDTRGTLYLGPSFQFKNLLFTYSQVLVQCQLTDKTSLFTWGHSQAMPESSRSGLRRTGGCGGVSQGVMSSLERYLSVFLLLIRFPVLFSQNHKSSLEKAGKMHIVLPRDLSWSPSGRCLPNAIFSPPAKFSLCWFCRVVATTLK